MRKWIKLSSIAGLLLIETMQVLDKATNIISSHISWHTVQKFDNAISWYIIETAQFVAN